MTDTKKSGNRPWPLLLALGLTMTPLILRAQDVAPAGKIPASGPVTVEWHNGFDYSGNVLHLRGNAALMSDAYELHAEELSVQLAAGKEKIKGASPVVTATAADPAHHTPVRGRFNQVSEGQEIQMTADTAVYHRDTTRPDGGYINFSGHVTMTLKDPVSLDGPGVTHSDRMVVLLGKGTDSQGQEYPQVKSGPGQATFTPLQ